MNLNNLKHILFISAIIFIILRIPSLFDPKYYLDEGVYASVAYEINQGGTLYKTAWDLKPPGIFVVYQFFQTLSVTNSFIYQRIFNILLGLIAISGLYQLTRVLKTSKTTTAAAIIIAAFLLGTPFFEPHIFNTENIFLVLSLWAFVLGLKYSNRWQGPFLAGFLFGLGQWFKIHPLFDLAAFSLFALYRYRLNLKFWLSLIAGFLTPLVFLFFYLFINGIILDFWETNFLYNLYYVKELPQITVFGSLITRTILLGIVTAIIFAMRWKKRISETSFLFLLWFFFSFYAALLSARAYNHYFLPVLIPTIGLLAIAVHKLTCGRKIAISAFTTALLVPIPFILFIFLQTHYNWDEFFNRIVSEQENYYQERLAYMFGKIDQRQFENKFTPKPWRLRELKNYLDTNYPNERSIYIWGNSPWAYEVLQRRPAQRYLMWFHVLGVGDREGQVMKDLNANLPNILIVEDVRPEGETADLARPPFENLQQFIDQYYLPKTKVAGYTIYQLLNQAALR